RVFSSAFSLSENTAPPPTGGMVRHGVGAGLLAALDVLHQAPFLGDLPGGKDVLLAGVGVLAAAELDLHGGAVEVEGAAIGFFQVAHIVVGDILGLVAVDDDQRRIAAAGVGVAQFDTAAVDQRRRMIRDRILENAGEVIGAQLVGGGGVGLVHGFVEIADTGAVEGGNKMSVGEIHEAQAPFKLDLDPVLL